MDERKCKRCNKLITKKSAWCSRRCRNADYSDAAGGHGILGDLFCDDFKNKSGLIGTVGELLVIIDLTLKGWEVFRAVSHSCSCDLVATKGSNVMKVEVTVGRKNPITKKTKYLKHNSVNYDVIAVVLQDKTIEYRGKTHDLVEIG